MATLSPVIRGGPTELRIRDGATRALFLQDLGQLIEEQRDAVLNLRLRGPGSHSDENFLPREIQDLLPVSGDELTKHHEKITIPLGQQTQTTSRSARFLG